MKKKGKTPSGGPAATLIGILTLLFVFYILFIPPEERRELLEENFTADGEDWVGDVLLNEAPGRLTYRDRSTYDHNIPNMYLSTATDARVIKFENPFVIKKGWFSEQQYVMRFTIDDVQTVESLILSWQAPVRAGVLKISLNGQSIFESRVMQQNPPPISLPKMLLASTNTLVFSVDGGWLSRRRYELADVKVIGELTDVSRKIGRNTFQLSRDEHENLETAYLDFFPICEQVEVGTMTITLNGKMIYSSVPSCESLNRQDIYKDDLRENRNEIVFAIEKGRYRIEQVRVKTILEDVKKWVDYFEVKSSLYNDVLDEDREIILNIEFVDDDKLKHAEINVNGRKDVIDQRDEDYERDISDWIREGNNYIEITPLRELNIVLVEVRVD